VATLADMLPIKDAAEITGLHWGTVQQIHQEHLEEVLGEPSLDGITHIAMDEFAIQKGHRYATVIADALTHRVLWVAKGNDRQAIRPFFEALGSVRCKAIQVAVMDMHSAFATEFHNHCPSAEVVYDKFHVLAKYNREVVDRVRVDRANELRDDKQARKVVKGSKWLLLRNRENLDEDDRIQLKDLLSANEPLAVVDLMRDDLRELWNCCDPIQAEREWTGWFQRAAESGVAALKSFARRLKKHVAGLVSYCRWRLTTGFLEGMNNKIKVIKRKAYGYRNDQYFFLRIRAAFPGTPDGRYPGIP
jgi:transposase